MTPWWNFLLYNFADFGFQGFLYMLTPGGGVEHMEELLVVLLLFLLALSLSHREEVKTKIVFVVKWNWALNTIKNCRLQLLCVLNISNVALPPPEWTLVYRCWWGVHVFASLPHVVGLQAGWSQLSPARVLQVMWQQHSRRVSHRHHWHQGQLQTGQVRPEQAKHFIINAEAEPLNPQTKKQLFDGELNVFGIFSVLEKKLNVWAQ